MKVTKKPSVTKTASKGPIIVAVLKGGWEVEISNMSELPEAVETLRNEHAEEDHEYAPENYELKSAYEKRPIEGLEIMKLRAERDACLMKLKELRAQLKKLGLSR